MVESISATATNGSQLQRFRDPQYREIYSNLSSTALSAFDITVVFQRVSEIIPGQNGVVDQVSVSFSPQQFKALVRSLTETLGGYERVFGAVQIPDVDTAPLKTAEQIATIVGEVRQKSHQARAEAAASTERSAKPSSTERSQHSKRSPEASRKKEP